VNSAEEAGIAGTPTFFIDEVLHRGGYDLASLTDGVERSLIVAAGRPPDFVEDEPDPTE
jgi:hypothetical protein